MEALTMQSIRELTALSLAAAGMFFLAPATASTLMQKDSAGINTLFSQTKPQCIGRYVIDVPASFNNQLHDMVFIDDFKIESKTLYPPAFKQRVRLREQALRDAINKPENEPENAPFIKDKIVLPDEKGIIFDRNISGEDDLGRVLEAHVFVNMTAFIIAAMQRMEAVWEQKAPLANISTCDGKPCVQVTDNEYTNKKGDRFMRETKYCYPVYIKGEF
nr:hypothetical protein [Pectobacterium odoriferum]